MKIGLIDVDGHNFPNLALMKISAHHNQGGECHAFVVGYNTSDDRLHESCEDVRHTKMCDANIDKFLNHYDNDSKD